MISDLKITFDDYDLTQYFDLTEEPNRGLFPEIENTLTEISNQTGTRITHSRFKEREITLEIYVFQRNIRALKDKLAELIATKTARLWFSDEPDRYFNAKLDGESSLIREETNSMEFTGTLKFLVPEGVSHSIYTTVATNFKQGYAGENLVLDPEFNYVNKYYQPWTYINDEKFNGSHVLSADFDDSTDTIHDETYRHMSILKLGLRKVNVKKGDKVSCGCWVRIRQFAEGDTTGRATFQLTVSEYGKLGGARLDWTSTVLTTGKLNEWVFFKVENIPIKQSGTKYIVLSPVVKRQSALDVSKPQMNLGATLLDYTVPDSQFLDSIPLPNDGTYPCYPTIKATLNGESGVVSFINSNGGVLQFGNPEEADVKPGKRSDKVAKYTFYGKNPKTDLKLNEGGVTAYKHFNGNDKLNIVQGSIDYKSYISSMAPVFKKDKNDVWHGPRLAGTLDKNFNNESTGDFQYVSRIIFKPRNKERGRIELYLYDETDTIVMGTVIRDSSNKNPQLKVEYHGHDGEYLKTRSLNRKTFNGSFWEVKMRRKGSKLIWEFGQVKDIKENNATKRNPIDRYERNFSAYENQKVVCHCLWFEKLSNTKETEMRWTDFHFTWINTPNWKNIPNLFDDGDEIEVDTENKQLLINGVVEQDSAYLAIDNEWDKFIIDKDYNEIQCVVSDWANTPEVSVEYEESYL